MYVEALLRLSTLVIFAPPFCFTTSALLRLPLSIQMCLYIAAALKKLFLVLEKFAFFPPVGFTAVCGSVLPLCTLLDRSVYIIFCLNGGKEHALHCLLALASTHFIDEEKRGRSRNCFRNFFFWFAAFVNHIDCTSRQGRLSSFIKRP